MGWFYDDGLLLYRHQRAGFESAIALLWFRHHDIQHNTILVGYLLCPLAGTESKTLVLFKGDIDGFRAAQMIQVKAQPAGNGMPFSRAATLDCIIWVAPFGRVVKQSLAALHLLTRTGPLPASCALRSTASRLAELVNIPLKEH